MAEKEYRDLHSEMAQEVKLPIGGAIVIPPHRTDLIAGAGLVYKDLGIDWSEYLPEGELQQVNGVDLYDCVSNGSVEAVEVQLNAFLIEGLLSENAKNWLIENGYLVNGKFDLSERYIAKLSGTDPQWGNTWQNVADAIRHWGVVPESKWDSNVSSIGEFYKDVPQSVKDLGLEFLKWFDITYEIVSQGMPLNRETIAYHLKHAPLQVIGFVCSGWNTQNPVKSCPPGGGQHCTLLYSLGSYNVLDTYVIYLKTLTDDYPLNFAGKIIIKEKSMISLDLIKKWLQGFYQAVGWTWDSSAWSIQRQNAILKDPVTEGKNFGIATKNNLGQLSSGWKKILINIIEKM